MVEAGLAASGFTEVGLLSLSSADHSEINEIAVDLADRYEGTNTGLSLPSTRVDAFNVTLADELSRNGRRSGLTFAPEGGSDRIRKVINKMVTEDDLIKTVTTAYASGWRQVKLYFMCGLPTETDEDVLAIAALAQRVIQAGRSATGRNDIRCTVSIGGFVPKPHTPVPVGGAVRSRDRGRAPEGARRARCGRTGGTARRSGSAITTASPPSSRDCCRVATGGSPRSSGRSGPTAAGSTGGARRSRSSAGSGAPSAALAAEGVDLAWYTTRERGYDEILPWDHLDAGLERDWLWQDWLAAIDPAGAAEVDDCRWTPCFECGVCPAMGTEIEAGPTGKRLLPLSVVGTCRRSRLRAAAGRIIRGSAPRERSRGSEADHGASAAAAANGTSAAASGSAAGRSSTLSVAGCDSRVIGISRERWSVGCGGLACRSHTRPGFLRIPRSPTRAGRRPAPPARPSSWRSPSPPAWTRTPCGSGSTQPCQTGLT